MAQFAWVEPCLSNASIYASHLFWCEQKVALAITLSQYDDANIVCLYKNTENVGLIHNKFPDLDHAMWVYSVRQIDKKKTVCR
jgi:hypothetical protein